MQVELLSYTPDALDLLLTTKNTRLKFDTEPAAMSDAEKDAHLEYMLGTIKSSWEFVDYTFRISGVTRAFTHQLVRTRTGSYAQESQRTVDVSDHKVLMPDLPTELDEGVWDHAVVTLLDAYAELIKDGVPVQDARGLLPTNITTSIIAKFNLRTLHETAKVRLCTRTQGEYQQVFRAMRECVLAVHPWTEPMLQVHCVSTGTCAFPRYGRKECKFWDHRMDNEQLKLDVKEHFWGSDIQSATPVAKDGMAS